MAKELSASDKITLERMKLMTSHRFFASILLRLNIIEINEKDPRSKTRKTLSVNAKGDLFYNTKFVNILSADHLKAVLCHEVMHVILGHCYRCPDKCDAAIWNYAVDLVVNHILVNHENMSLPEDISALMGEEDINEINDKRKKDPNYGKALIPRKDGFYTIYIEDKSYDIAVEGRTAEAIYFELMKIIPKSDDDSECERVYIGSNIDEHILDNENGSCEESSGLSEEEKSELDRKWAAAIAAANLEDSSNARALSRGWASRQLSEFARPQINWKVALHRYIKEVLPYDCSYVRPSKRTYSTGVYTPTIHKKPENIIVAIDVSGSIGNEDLKKFVTEVYGILKSYTNVGVRVLFWSSVVDRKNDTVFTIAKIPKILDVEPYTTGATCISCVEDYLKTTISKESAIVYITDGYVEGSPIFKCNEKKRLFIISSNGSEEILSKFGVTAKLKL